jgi:hypothetical protein
MYSNCRLFLLDLFMLERIPIKILDFYYFSIFIISLCLREPKFSIFYGQKDKNIL